MLKEIKVLLYVFTILVFFFLCLKYYLSDTFEKKIYRTHNNYQKIVIEFSENLKIFKSDTDGIIEYIDNEQNDSKKKFQFWKLIEND